MTELKDLTESEMAAIAAWLEDDGKGNAASLFVEQLLQARIYWKQSAEASANQLRGIDEAVKEYSAKTKVWNCGTLAQQVRTKFRDYDRERTQLLAQLRQFREDVQVYLRAIQMQVEAIANAGTHAQKSARLGGVIGVIESALYKLREDNSASAFKHWENPNLFSSDYPERVYVQKIHELEQRLAQLEPPVEPASPFEDITF